MDEQDINNKHCHFSKEKYYRCPCIRQEHAAHIEKQQPAIDNRFYPLASLHKKSINGKANAK